MSENDPPGRPLGDGLDPEGLEAAAEAICEVQWLSHAGWKQDEMFGKMRSAYTDLAHAAISTYLRLTSTPTSNASGEGELRKELTRRGKLLKRRERRMEKLEAVADAARNYGTDQELMHDETGDPHDRSVCRTCIFADALDVLDFGATPTPETETTSMAASSPQKMVDPYGPPSTTVGEEP